MRYNFKIRIDTDGTFEFPFVPCGMIYDDLHSYSLFRTYDDRKSAVEDINQICKFIIGNIVSDRDLVKYEIDDFATKFYKMINDEANYDLPKIELREDTSYHIYFELSKDLATYTFNLEFDEDEEKLINDNQDKVTYDDVKEAVLNLFRQRGNCNDGISN